MQLLCFHDEHLSRILSKFWTILQLCVSRTEQNRALGFGKSCSERLTPRLLGCSVTTVRLSISVFRQLLWRATHGFTAEKTP